MCVCACVYLYTRVACVSLHMCVWMQIYMYMLPPTQPPALPQSHQRFLLAGDLEVSALLLLDLLCVWI